ncbi:MAG: dephospho-CoA kinase [Aerococcaceae bacterium]|nr:dephospho-CoA kinase [Aerococcaceae bacterium]
MYKIGLTGGIATGKTTVANYLQSKKIPVIDADLIARQVVEPNSEGLRRLQIEFGDWIMNTDSTLNRSALGERVFAEPQLLAKLNAMLHPLIFAEIERQYSLMDAPLCVIDMPLLYEVGYDKQVDEVWVVFATSDIQLDRLMERNDFTRERAQQMIDAQIPIEKKLALADYVIDNQGTLDATYAQIDLLLQSERRNPHGLPKMSTPPFESN